MSKRSRDDGCAQRCYLHEAVEDMQHVIRERLRDHDMASAVMLSLTCRHELARFRRSGRGTHIMVHAARTGHLPLVRWVLSRYPKAREAYTLKAWLLVPAAEAGQQALLAHYIPRKIQAARTLQDVMEAAARGGRLVTLQWLAALAPDAFSVAAGATLRRAAVTSGNLDVIAWVYGGAKLIRDTEMAHALAQGHVHVADWLMAHGGQPLNNPRYVYEQQVRLWSVPGLEWLIARQVPAPDALCDAVLDYFHDKKLEKLDWLRAHIHPSLRATAHSIVVAVRAGDLACVQWLRRELQCPWDRMATLEAVQHDNVPMVTYLLNAHCPFTPKAMIDEAKSPEMLTLLLLEKHMDQHLTHDERQVRMENAAERKAWTRLKWLAEHGQDYTCPPRVWTLAMEQRNRPMLQWLLEHGAPVAWPDKEEEEQEGDSNDDDDEEDSEDREHIDELQDMSISEVDDE
jgi:hypothetical protein